MIDDAGCDYDNIADVIGSVGHINIASDVILVDDNIDLLCATYSSHIRTKLIPFHSQCKAIPRKLHFDKLT